MMWGEVKGRGGYLSSPGEVRSLRHMGLTSKKSHDHLVSIYHHSLVLKCFIQLIISVLGDLQTVACGSSDVKGMNGFDGPEKHATALWETMLDHVTHVTSSYDVRVCLLSTSKIGSYDEYNCFTVCTVNCNENIQRQDRLEKFSKSSWNNPVSDVTDVASCY